MSEENKELDILDEVKNLEKVIKAKTLQRVVKKMKESARKVLELKEETHALLDTLKVSEKDSKRLIDFVNTLEEVTLSEMDKKGIKEDAKRYVHAEKEKVSSKIDQMNYQSSPFSTSSTNFNGYGTNAPQNVMFSSTNGETDIKLEI